MIHANNTKKHNNNTIKPTLATNRIEKPYVKFIKTIPPDSSYTFENFTIVTCL